MKAIDLHIHTIPTISDSDFQYDLEVLKEYVITQKLDAIAITNHNIFDLAQFKTIQKALDIIVFPGIEVNLAGGHILVIASAECVKEFDLECKLITTHINDPKDFIDLGTFKSIFKKYEDYLLIPHYHKRPRIKSHIIDELGKNIIAGEVKNAKDFFRCKKEDGKITPVLFSDLRIDKNINKSRGRERFPVRKTFIKVDHISIL